MALSLLSVYVYGDMLVGGLERDDPTDPDVVKAAIFAVSGFNQLSNEEYDYKMMKIVSAESQVNNTYDSCAFLPPSYHIITTDCKNFIIIYV